MNKVSTKLAIFAIVLSLVSTILSLYLGYSNLKTVETMFQARQEEKESLFDNLLKLKSESLLSYAYDYTYWDEMVTLVEKGNLAFARENIDPSLATYKANAAWVYRLDFSQAYSVNNLNEPAIKEFPLPPESLRRAFGNNLFPHFFVKTDLGVMEVAGAPIQPSADIQRKTSPHGFFLVGRLWDQAYFDSFSTLMGGKIERNDTDSDQGNVSSDEEQGVVILQRKLTGFDGKTVLGIHGEIKTGAIAALSQNTTTQFYYLIFSSLAVAAILIFFLFRWVIKPISQISRTLSEEDPKHIEKLRHSHDEFGQIANMIVKFFEQRASLVGEIEQRAKAQRTLETQKEELERLNKTMVGRELKMVELKEEIEKLKKGEDGK